MAKTTYKIVGEDATDAAFRSALGKAKTTADKMSGMFKAAFAGISVAVFAGLGRQAIETGDNLEKFRVRAKLSGEAASSLAYAAKQSDVEIDALGTSLQKMQIFLSKAQSGTEANVETLEALGIQIDQIKDLQADKQFELIADQVSKLASEEDQARAVTEVFGKAGGNLLPMFQQGARGIREAREEAQKLGAVFSDEQLGQLAKADDAIKRMNQSWDAMALTLTAKVAPGIRRTLDNLSGFDSRTIDEKIADLEAKADQFQFMGEAMQGSPEAQRRADVTAELDNLRRIQRMSRGGRRGGDRGASSAGEPPGFESVAKDSEKELELTADKLVDITDRANDAIFEQHMERMEDEAEAERENWRIFEEAGIEAQEAVAQHQRELQEQRQQDTERLGELLDDQLMNAFKRGKEGWKDMIQYWAMQFAMSGLNKLFGGFMGGTGSTLGGTIAGAVKGGGAGFAQGEWDWMGGIFGGLGSIFGFANGGRPPRNRPSIIGEEGPELWKPDGTGQIIPLGRMGGGAASVNLSIHNDNRGASLEFIKQLPAIQRQQAAQIKAEIVHELNRKRYR
jgi:hypothetical protein